MVKRQQVRSTARWLSVALVAVVAAVTVAGCASGAGTGGAGSPAAGAGAAGGASAPGTGGASRSGEHSGAESAVSLACTGAPASLTDSIASGLVKPVTGLAGALFVRTESVHGVSAVVAARLLGVSRTPVGTWWISKPINEPGDIAAVNAAARRWSNWGTLAAPGSVDAKIRSQVAASAAHAAALKCASSKNAHVTAPPASDSHHCWLRTRRNVIEWMKTPGQPAQAQLLGDVDYITCAHTYEQADLAKTSPKGPGFCTAVAFAADNRGYRINAVPAARPAHVVAQVGGAC